MAYIPALYRDPPGDTFYDQVVIGQTCDMVRVMCYDMYYAKKKNFSGPTSTKQWAKEAMQYWLQYVPPEKLIMGLPAYSNDYDLTPNVWAGKQVYHDKPQVGPEAKVDRRWLYYERVHMYRYLDEKGNIHIFYASDAKSTAAHLKTVDELGITGIAFWYYQAVSDETWQVVREWWKNE